MKINYLRTISSFLVLSLCFISFSPLAYLSGYDENENNFPVLKKGCYSKILNETQSGVTFLMDESGIDWESKMIFFLLVS